MNKMLQLASAKEIENIALPKIGAGLGGLNWTEVKNALEQIAKQYPKVHLWVVENYKAD